MKLPVVEFALAKIQWHCRMGFAIPVQENMGIFYPLLLNKKLPPFQETAFEKF